MADTFESCAIFSVSAIAVLSFILLLWFSTKPNKNRCVSPTNWPLVGMIPALVRNLHRIHDYATEVLIENGGTFEFRGPLFCNLDMLVTCDPTNIHHIFSRNFNNYPKGPEFKKIFDVLGDGIFNSDFELWRIHRKTTHSILNHTKFHGVLERVTWEKVEAGLIPVLDHCRKQGMEIDLVDVLERYAFDIISKILLSHDPCSLSVGFPCIPSEKAVGDALESLLHRHILPEMIWKLQKRLNVGHERKLAEAQKDFDDFLYPLLSGEPPVDDDELETFRTFREAYEESKKMGLIGDDQMKFMRDTFLGLMVAGRDSTSSVLPWLLSHMAADPSIETKILHETRALLGETWRRFSMQESCKLVYLHATISETLRLHPPIALEHKSPSLADMLPSGNSLRPHTKVLVSFYSTGRMESVWGEDCLEFKPERWISKEGRIKHEASFKFPAFNAGPRACPGKEMAFFQLKVATAAFVYHYGMELAGEWPAAPTASIMLKMKNGFKVKLVKRNGRTDIAQEL